MKYVHHSNMYSKISMTFQSSYDVADAKARLPTVSGVQEKNGGASETAVGK